MNMYPVPKDSYPHRVISSVSIKFPKNFQPVGVSYNLIPSFFVTLSRAPDVGILRAAPLIFYLRKRAELEVKTAIESDGVTKKAFPKIMFLSALNRCYQRLHRRQHQILGCWEAVASPGPSARPNSLHISN